MTESTVWIRTEPTHDNTGYVVTLEASEDRSRVLTPSEALAHAQGVLEAAQRAAYDAAVARQMRSKVPPDVMAQLIADLRKDRPDLDPAATAPLTLVPGVNAKLEPFLAIHLDDEPLGQWTVPDANSHALGVIEAVVVADLDSGYLRTLIGLVGLDRATAQRVVADLINWRTT